MFGCMKELLQAKVRSVYHLGDFKVDPEHREQLVALPAGIVCPVSSIVWGPVRPRFGSTPGTTSFFTRPFWLRSRAIRVEVGAVGRMGSR
jgi:hypothetical protein